ncbi:MAG: PBP1A family penicillin-binding protein [Candidatus Eisenbacteria bacterium]|uniref:peptidoglycan glycosyltransferase n=1 Tax=Eiseniibacteriota bacterium TaxID=2212470 RepID=A0A538UDY4_UNCEI|nr:MAG: PBP1A family penicillin-binding protein [Candidatus Eisenbacteria bacterium]
MTHSDSGLAGVARPAVRAALRFPWKLFFGLVVFAVFAAAGVVFGVVQWLRHDLASPEALLAIKPPVKTVVYDYRGRVLHEFFKENRSPVPLRQIPRNLINATIATEDRNFYHHWGVDLWGIARAAVTDLTHLKIKEGGSTITQLLARNVFLTHERTITRKLKEVALAIEIERNYSKDQILELYFNQIYFGEGAHGVEAAAKTYFGKPLRELNLAECALIAGIPANPNLYSPRHHPAAARARRAKVLRNMLATGACSQVEFDNAMSAPLGVTPMRYRNDRAPFFVEMVRLHLDQKYGSNAVYEGGLKVYTTLDMDLQQIAERALEKQLSALESELRIKKTMAAYVPPADSLRATQLPDYLQGAAVAIDPRTGYIRALIGGRSWDHSNFNRAVQARRQPGSAFKPFVYTAAMDNGFHPTDVIVDEPESFPGADGELWQPQNYDHLYRGPVTLRYALQQSINIPAIKLLRKVSTSLVASYARRMGIRSPVGQNLSLALGTSEVTLLELTSAYGVFADRGIRNDPIFVLEVEDASGNVLEKNAPRPVEVLSEGTASVMTSMLQSVMDHGTGFPARARGFTAPAAGKTGTMDDYMDAWFVGFVPSLVCGVWVGYDEKRPIGPGMTGARAALPAWTDIMIGATRGRPVEDFPVPAGTISREVCAESGMLATDACPNVTTEIFDEHAEPTEYCTIHRGRPLQQPATTTTTDLAAPSRQAPTLRDLDQKARGKEKIHT